MNALYRLLRVIPLAFLCAVLSTAALRVHAERSGDGMPVPNRLGQSHKQISFAEATVLEVQQIYTELAIIYFPGVVPGPIAANHATGNSLDALKARNRTLATGRTTY